MVQFRVIWSIQIVSVKNRTDFSELFESFTKPLQSVNLGQFESIPTYSKLYIFFKLSNIN